MALGTSTLAAFTDFLFHDDGKAALLARHHAGDLQAGRAILFWYCLSAYRKAMEEAGKWEVD